MAVALPTSYESLLRTAGFVDIAAVDLTSEYRATQQRWIDATRLREPEIREILGDEKYEERAVTRERALEAIDEGLLKRFQYLACRR